MTSVITALTHSPEWESLARKMRACGFSKACIDVLRDEDGAFGLQVEIDGTIFISGCHDIPPCVPLKSARKHDHLQTCLEGESAAFTQHDINKAVIGALLGLAERVTGAPAAIHIVNDRFERIICETQAHAAVVAAPDLQCSIWTKPLPVDPAPDAMPQGAA